MGGGSLFVDHQFAGCGFGSSGFYTRGYFLLGLPSSRVRGCCRFGIRLFGLAVFLLAVTLGCLSASVTGWGDGFGNGDEFVVALKIRPLRQRVSTYRPGPSARQRTLPHELSECQGGLLRLYFGHARALALQEPLRFFALNTTPVICPVFSPHHSTEAVPDG